LPRGKPTATLSERFPRQSVAKSIDGMSHQHADAQNEGRSHNSSRKHELSPRSKSIKEDEHMHSQKNFGDRTRFDRDRCALATATCLQHPERPTWALRGWSRSAVIGVAAKKEVPATRARTVAAPVPSPPAKHSCRSVPGRTRTSSTRCATPSCPLPASKVSGAFDSAPKHSFALRAGGGKARGWVPSILEASVSICGMPLRRWITARRSCRRPTLEGVKHTC
jgi:hypothetical protein